MTDKPQAEKSLLGTMLRENHLIDDTSLTPEHFLNATHQRIFDHMRTLRAKGQSVDVATLLIYYDPRELGGAAYLQEMERLANPPKFDDYERAIMDAWKDREKKNIVSKAMMEDWNVDQIMSALDQLQDGETGDRSSLSNSLAKYYEAPWTPLEEERGVTSGLRDLDALTGGFRNAEMTIIAARPSAGKTDVLLHCAKQAGWLGYLPIVFSLEMSSESLEVRMIGSTGGYNRTKLRNPEKHLSDKQKGMWIPALEQLAKTDMEIFDGAGQTVPVMRAKVRKMVNEKQKHPVIFIDYLTLIKPVNHHNSMHLQVSEISKALKGMAKEFNCPVIVLAQLSRAVEQRPDKRPMLSDLRESGSIEEDADMVISLYRDSYYTKDDEDRTLELGVLKNRNGPVGIAKVNYNKFSGEITDQ